MVLIIGGRFQGKRHYLESLTKEAIYDCAKIKNTAIKDQKVIYGLETYIKSSMKAGISIEALLDEIETWEADYIVGCEIGLGVVPVEQFDRLYRDNVGLIYQRLARKASSVTRVFAGIPIQIKP